MSAVKNEIFEYALREYGAKPEYLWANDREAEEVINMLNISYELTKKKR